MDLQARQPWPGQVALFAVVCALAAAVAGCARSNPRLGQDATVQADVGIGGDGGAVCGNGLWEPGEGCDDGNQVNGDGCSAACTEEVCDPTLCPEGCCGAQGGCLAGTRDDACGESGTDCVDCAGLGEICADHACQSAGGCTDGDTQACGYCGERSCSAGGTWGSCESQGACGSGMVEVTGSCGQCGELSRVCQSDCTWSGLECRNEGACAPGTVEPGQACGLCGHEERTCQNDCTWSAWDCVIVQDCVPDAVETGAACGDCGHQERTCQSDCTFGGWECVGEGECAAGTTSGQGCTCGEKTCSTACTWGSCVTFTEQCNGQDDDCDGVCDNGFVCCQGQSEPCQTACGSTGTRTCATGCTWSACQAPAEVCNGQDDDCDGFADEGWRAASENPTYTGLAAYNTTCNGSTERYGLNCNRAIHGWCAAQACGESGFGPVENNGNDAYVTCVAGDGLRTVPWATMQQYQVSCSLGIAISDICYSAYSRYCQSLGYDSGFGPVEATSASVTVFCVTGGTVYHTNYTALAAKHPVCDGSTEAVGPSCNAAIHRFCWQDHGHTSGFGPVEHSGNNVNVVCVDP